MRVLRGFIRFFLGLVGALLSARAAHAQQLLVAAPEAGAPAVEHAELAYAFGDGSPVTWLSLRLERGPAAVVVALSEAGEVSEGLDAWLAALEDTASPFVLPPVGTRQSCGQTLSPVRVAWPRSPGVAALELSLQSSEDVRSVLAERGLRLAAPLPEAARYVVWSWPDALEPLTTRTLRVLGEAEPLSLAPSWGFPVLVSALTRGAWSCAAEHLSGELRVTYRVGEDQSSNYRERLDAWFEARQEPVLELRARGPIFDWAVYDVASVAPLVWSYARRAASERSNVDAEACYEKLATLRESGVLPPAELEACADALDASLGLAAARSDVTTLSRLVMSSGLGVSAQSFSAGGASRTPLLHASQLDDTSCSEPPSTTPVIETPTPRRDPSAPPPPIERSVDQGQTPVVVESQPVEINCWGSPRPEPDPAYQDDELDCSGHTASSSEGSSDEDCSQGSSTPEDDSDCASDSSSSSDQQGDACSGDSSSGEESGYDGDTCTGNAAPRRTQATRPRRLKTSLWSLALAAAMLPIRRRKRGLRAGG